MTEHQSLKWLNNIGNLTGRLAHWAMELRQWDYDERYRRGSDNGLTDVLSRQLLDAVQTHPQDHPEYCIRETRLYFHILRTLDFNDNDPSEDWTRQEDRERRPGLILARNLQNCCQVRPELRYSGPITRENGVYRLGWTAPKIAIGIYTHGGHPGSIHEMG